MLSDCHLFFCAVSVSPFLSSGCAAAQSDAQCAPCPVFELESAPHVARSVAALLIPLIDLCAACGFLDTAGSCMIHMCARPAGLCCKRTLKSCNAATPHASQHLLRLLVLQLAASTWLGQGLSGAGWVVYGGCPGLEG